MKKLQEGGESIEVTGDDPTSVYNIRMILTKWNITNCTYTSQWFNCIVLLYATAGIQMFQGMQSRK